MRSYIQRKVSDLIKNEGEEFKLLYKYSNISGDISSPISETEINVTTLKDNAWSSLIGYVYSSEVSELELKRTKIITMDIPFNPINVSLEKSTTDELLGDITSLSLIINSETVDISTALDMGDVATAINSSSIDGAGAFIDDGYLVIYKSNSSNNNAYESLILSGTALTNIGFTSGTKKERPPKILAKGREYTIRETLEGIYKKTLILGRL